MSGIKDYSTTPANNNAAPPNGFPEGMAPASLNDGMRQVMADIRSWFENPEWVDFGNTPTQTGANAFTVASDLTSRYTVGTRIRMIGTTPFTLYGTISAVSFSSPNTSVTVAMDSGSLNSTLNAIAINQSLKTSQFFLSNVFSMFDATDVTKKIAFALSGITTGTTRTITIPNKSGTMAMTDDVPTVPTIRGYLDGCQMSTAGSSATMTIGAGQAVDSTNTGYITLAASIDKTTSSWAVGSGNGGLDTGSIANSTWYYFYAIVRVDTSVEDVIFSTNASSPALPTNYTLYRYIGAGLTNGSGQWTRFVQSGDQFDFTDTILDISSTNPGTSAVTRTLTVPRRSGISAGIKFWVTDIASTGGTNNGVLITPLDTTDEAPTLYTSTSPNSDVGGIAAGSTIVGALWGQKYLRCNSSGQVRSRLNVSDANKTLYIRTFGWTDLRGKE